MAIFPGDVAKRLGGQVPNSTGLRSDLAETDGV